jgi:hypothetical protein
LALHPYYPNIHLFKFLHYFTFYFLAQYFSFPFISCKYFSPLLS